MEMGRWVVLLDFGLGAGTCRARNASNLLLKNLMNMCVGDSGSLAHLGRGATEMHFLLIFFAGQWIKLLANLFGSFQRASASIFHVHYSLCVFTARYLGKRGSSFVQGLARKRMTGIQYIDVYSLCRSLIWCFEKVLEVFPPTAKV